MISFDFAEISFMYEKYREKSNNFIQKLSKTRLKDI